MYDKFAQWLYSGGEPERTLTKDEMLDDITLFWLTNTAVSAARLYVENKSPPFAVKGVSIPVAAGVFPDELYQAPARYWATEYDWRKVEARLNALPQFTTKIDGLDIQSVHVRSKRFAAIH